MHPSLLKPDAIIEIPARRRRLFVEAETGTQSIATAHPGRNGAIVSKLSRYSGFFDGLAAPRHERDTWYDDAFPDRFEPRLVFLVHSEERLARVNAALKEWLGSNGSARFRVLVYTFADAAGVLAPYTAHARRDAPLRRGREGGAPRQRRHAALHRVPGLPAEGR